MIEKFIALRCASYVATGPVIKWRIHHLVFLFTKEYYDNENIFKDFTAFYQGPWSMKLDVEILNNEKYFKYYGNRMYALTNEGYKTMLKLQEWFPETENKFKEFFDNHGSKTFFQIQKYIKNNYPEYYPKHFDLPITVI